jgi:hypothetical protein
MATSTSTLATDEQVRVQDYLNDKIQTSTDFESLESLLSNLRTQHELQRKQVRHSLSTSRWLPRACAN